MNWSEEWWIKVYTRDESDWLMLSMEAQALFLLLLRKVNRSGQIDAGRHGRSGIFLSLGHAHRTKEWEPFLLELEADGCVTWDGKMLLIPNFLAAQTARTSDAVRKRMSRANEDALSKSAKLGSECHSTSHAVTAGHIESQHVTTRLDKKRLEETREEEPKAAVAAPVALELIPRDPVENPAPKSRQPKKDRPLSAISLELTETVFGITDVRYPPSSWDLLEGYLRKGSITPEQARLVVKGAALERFYREDKALSPSLIFQAKRWQEFAARAEAKPTRTQPRNPAMYDPYMDTEEGKQWKADLEAAQARKQEAYANGE